MSDTYYCAKTGKPFEADWSVRCECPKCMPLDAPIPCCDTQTGPILTHQVVIPMHSNGPTHSHCNDEPPTR